MTSIAQISENEQMEIAGSLKKFFADYKVRDLLKACRAEKQKGHSAFEIFRYLLCLVFCDRSMYMQIILYCADCGSRMTFAHNETKRKLADGTIKVYERDMYRCYRKISSKFTCAGQTSYDMKLIDPAVEAEVRKFLVQLGDKPREELLEIASARNVEAYQIAMQQAEKDLENAQRQVTALEEEAFKALTGESQLDFSIVNTMLVKHRAKMDAAEQALTTARAKLEAETQNAKETKAQIDELLSWAECFDKANTETKHIVFSLPHEGHFNSWPSFVGRTAG